MRGDTLRGSDGDRGFLSMYRMDGGAPDRDAVSIRSFPRSGSGSPTL